MMLCPCCVCSGAAVAEDYQPADYWSTAAGHDDSSPLAREDEEDGGAFSADGAVEEGETEGEIIGAPLPLRRLLFSADSVAAAARSEHGQSQARVRPELGQRAPLAAAHVAATHAAAVHPLCSGPDPWGPGRASLPLGIPKVGCGGSGAGP